MISSYFYFGGFMLKTLKFFSISLMVIPVSAYGTGGEREIFPRQDEGHLQLEEFVCHELSKEVQFSYKQLDDHLTKGPSGRSILKMAKLPIQGVQQCALSTRETPINERTRVETTNQWPHCTIGRLESTLGLGSGVLISPHHVLTCAHNVSNCGRRAQNVSFSPGVNGKATPPFGTIPIVRMYIYKKWEISSSGDENFDLALLILARPAEERIGYMGLASAEDDALGTEIVEISGYPGDKDGEMWTMFNRLKKPFKSETFSYEIDTSPGQSGSPIWISNLGSPSVIGIHTRGSTTENYGTRLSRHKFNDLIRLMSETGEIRTTVGRPVLSVQADLLGGKLATTAAAASTPGSFTEQVEIWAKDFISTGNASALTRLQDAANRDCAEAAYRLAEMYKNGDGFLQDFLQAAVYYQKAIGKLPEAQAALALLYINKWDVFGGTHSTDEILELLFRAADLGNNMRAEETLGDIYRKGFLNISRDYMKAAQYYQRAANKQSGKALFELSEMYEDGKGVPKNLAKSIEYLQKSLKQDYDDAYIAFAVHQILGDATQYDIPKNPAQAVQTLEHFALKGNASAQFNLGCIYGDWNICKLQHVYENPDNAISLWTKSANQGNAGAQFELGKVCHYGKYGRRQNLQEAASWYKKAAQQGHVRAQELLDTFCSQGEQQKKDCIIA